MLTRNFPVLTPPFRSGVISGIAILTNTSSICFFFRAKNKGLGSVLLMLLNFLDLLLSFSATLMALFTTFAFNDTSGRWCLLAAAVCEALWRSLALGAGFVTLILSMTRCISICFPFFQIRVRVILVWTVVFISVTLGIYQAYKIGHVISHVAFAYSHLVVAGSLILAVLSSDAILIAKLWRRGRKSSAKRKCQSESLLHSWKGQNRQVTITVLILSAVFCTLNFFDFAAYLIGTLWYMRGTVAPIYEEFTVKGIYAIAIPLNSAVNPIIYFTRKRSMRQFIRGLIMGEDKTAKPNTKNIKTTTFRETV